MRWQLAMLFVLWLGLACSESIEVLGVEERTVIILDASDLAEPDDFDDDLPDSSTIESPCQPCNALELCAVDSCVSAAGVTALDAWLTHTCSVTDGQLRCWGNNDQSQLGLGDAESRDRPTRVGSFNDWLSVSTGERHTCGLRAPGVLYCFGENDSGELGLGHTTSRSSPEPIEADVLFRSVSCGGESCCALDENRALRCWGDNLEGKPGLADPYGSPDVTRPTKVDPGPFLTLDVGQGHVCAIRMSGELLCWGRNSMGETGTRSEDPQLRSPTRVGEDADWITVSASQHHSCGVREGGTLYCWGLNEHFELAAPDGMATYATPVPVQPDVTWAEVSVGWFHTCAVTRESQLYCWGRAIEGQLGQGGSEDPVPIPTAIATLASPSLLTLGSFHTCAMIEASVPSCWGANDAGQLGVGDRERRHMPELLSAP